MHTEVRLWEVQQSGNHVRRNVSAGAGPCAYWLVGIVELSFYALCCPATLWKSIVESVSERVGLSLSLVGSSFRGMKDWGRDCKRRKEPPYIWKFMEISGFIPRVRSCRSQPQVHVAKCTILWARGMSFRLDTNFFIDRTRLDSQFGFYIKLTLLFYVFYCPDVREKAPWLKSL